MSLPAGETPGDTAAPKGVLAEASRLFSSLSRHFQALVELAGVEGREALALYITVAIALGAAIVLAFFFYIFLLLFIAFLLAKTGVDWIWITLGITVAHLLGVLGCLLYAKTHYRKPVFKGTMEEVRRDIAALRGPKS